MSRSTRLNRLDALTPWQAAALGCATAAIVVIGTAQLNVWYGCVAGLACLGAAVPLALGARWIIEAARVPFDRLPATEFRPAFLHIEAGEFLMGSPDGVGDAGGQPQRPVSLDPFHVGETVATQAQWTPLGCETRFDFHDSTANPAENVNWYDAVGFRNAVSEHEGLAPAYRLSGRRRSRH